MSDASLSTFNLYNSQGFPAPHVFTGMREDSGDVIWYVNLGATRLYLTRIGNPLDMTGAEQAADAHFMARIVTSALLMGGAGFFKARLIGRVELEGIDGDIRFHHSIETTNAPAYSANVEAWFGSLVADTTLKRAAQDAYLALDNPDESLVYVYRGFEWIVQMDGVSWDQIAADIGTTAKNMQELKRMANAGDVSVRRYQSRAKAPCFDGHLWKLGLRTH